MPQPSPLPPTSCPHTTDPPLLSQHSTFKTYTTSRYTYPSLRIFHRPHPQALDPPARPARLPLLVFVHGLGGSVAQFYPLLSSLVHVAPCLAVDLPGCGRSAFTVKDWDAYAQQALAELLGVIIEDHREPDKRLQQGVVLVGHSMGTSLCAMLASCNGRAGNTLGKTVIKGLVAICPVASAPEPMPPLKLLLVNALFWVPGWLFDCWRRMDRRGGLESKSVLRFVGQGAGLELRALQHRFNEQSRTPVWRRMAHACIPAYGAGGAQAKGLAGEKEWRAVHVPVFLVAGAADNVTSPSELDKIAAFFEADRDAAQTGRAASPASPRGNAIPDSAAPVDSAIISNPASPSSTSSSPSPSPSSLSSPTLPAVQDIYPHHHHHHDPITPSCSPPPTAFVPPQPARPARILKSQLLPAPANHTLLYHPVISRTVAGLISDFLTAHVSPRLSLAWQLQHLSREGKWDVKNLAKWKGVVPVSAPIGPPDNPPVFRAMKTLREADKEHCPAVFAARWAGEITDVVDISHDQPVYDPRGLEKAGLQYHKFPTVSKIPPTALEVADFIAVVDRIRATRSTAAKPPTAASGARDAPVEGTVGHDEVVGVHCHYGFNRTGYFIVCYLVERCGMTVQEAIAEFATKRPNGIRHTHFLDRLFVRYTIGGCHRYHN